MFSAKKKPPEKYHAPDAWQKARKLLAPRGEFKPRLSMRIWLTALFVLVTALAAVTAYQIVHPILFETLNRSSEAAFKQVGDQFEEQVQRLRERGESLNEQRRRPRDGKEPIKTGVHKGQQRATYAYPIDVDFEGKDEPQPRPVVFIKYYTQ